MRRGLASAASAVVGAGAATAAITYWLVLVAGAVECAPIALNTDDRVAPLCFVASRSEDVRSAVLYLPGDRGSRGFAAATVEHLAQRGHDVYIIETPEFLGALPPGTTAASVGRRLASIGRSVQTLAGDRPILVGWSAGAGLALLAAAEGGTSPHPFSSVVLVALVPHSPLSWNRWRLVSGLLLTVQPRRSFATDRLLPAVAPTPLAMIVSDNDHHVSIAETEALFDAAREPKRLFVVAAENHRFGGGQPQFFEAFDEALGWPSSMR